MTNAQKKQAALAAIRAMEPEARAAFIKMYEANDPNAGKVARAYSIEGISRQVRLASMALESSRIMEDLTEVVCDKITA